MVKFGGYGWPLVFGVLAWTVLLLVAYAIVGAIETGGML